MRSIIILGSSRKEGNTFLMAKHLQSLTGFDIINLSDYRIGYFNYDHNYEDDDYLKLMSELIEQYDRFIFATPVYWYTMSAIMKTFFDRFSDLLRAHKELGRKLRGKSMAVLSCGHANDLVNGFEMPFENSANYLGMSYEGNCYTWSEAGEILSEVEEAIQMFANQLKENESN